MQPRYSGIRGGLSTTESGGLERLLVLLGIVGVGLAVVARRGRWPERARRAGNRGSLEKNRFSRGLPYDGVCDGRCGRSRQDLGHHVRDPDLPDRPDGRGAASALQQTGGRRLAGGRRGHPGSRHSPRRREQGMFWPTLDYIVAGRGARLLGRRGLPRSGAAGRDWSVVLHSRGLCWNLFVLKKKRKIMLSDDIDSFENCLTDS